MKKLPLWAWAVALLLLAAGTAGTALLQRSHDRRQQAFAARLAASARDAARDGLKARLEVIAGQGATFAALPQLRAQLSIADMQTLSETLRDGFRNEPWWQPVRLEFRVYGVATGGDGLDVVEGEGMGAADLDVRDLVRTARAQRQASGVVPARSKNGWPYLAAAAVIDAIGQPKSVPAVLVLARPLDEAIARELSQRAGSPVVLHDGKSALLAVGDHKEQLQALADKGDAAPLAAADGRWAAARQELAPGLWLWTLAAADGHADEESGDLTSKVVLWGLVALGIAGAFVAGARAQKPPPAQPLAPTGSTPTGLPALSAPPLFTPATGSHALAFSGNTTPPTGVGPAGSTGPQPHFPLGDAEGVTAVSHAAAAAAPSNVFGRYMLLDRLGEGGMAEVYTAVAFGAENFRRTFVVKRLRAEMMREPSVVSAFIDEANLASSLVHSNIVPVFDFGKVGDEYFLAQEYILGRDLGRVTRRSLEREQKPIPAAQVFFVASEVLRALEYAHTRTGEGGRPLGIVHRDVSPNNILVSARGEVKLFDFGIAKAEGRLTQTQHGIVKGNVRFMSPEQARGVNIDSRADLFSLGLVIYYAIAGDALYQGGNSYELLVRAASGPGAEEMARIAALPEPANRLLNKALQPEPDARFQTAGEFATALQPYLAGAGASLARTMEKLFAADIQEEEARFAAAVTPGATGAQRVAAK